MLISVNNYIYLLYLFPFAPSLSLSPLHAHFRDVYFLINCNVSFFLQNITKITPAFVRSKRTSCWISWEHHRRRGNVLRLAPRAFENINNKYWRRVDASPRARANRANGLCDDVRRREFSGIMPIIVQWNVNSFTSFTSSEWLTFCVRVFVCVCVQNFS